MCVRRFVKGFSLWECGGTHEGDVLKRVDVSRKSQLILEVTYELHLDGVGVKKRLSKWFVVRSSKRGKVSVCAWSANRASAKRPKARDLEFSLRSNVLTQFTKPPRQ